MYGKFLFNNIVKDYGSKIREALVYNTQTATMQSIAILRTYKDQAEKELQVIIDAWNKSNPNETWSDFTDIDYDKLTYDQKVIYDKWIKQAQSSSDAIEKAWASLEVSTNNITEKFVNDAAMSSLKTITVVHGKGTGVLRNAVHLPYPHRPAGGRLF